MRKLSVLLLLFGLLTTAVSANAAVIKVLSSQRAGDIANGDGDDDLVSFYQNNGFQASLFNGAVSDAELNNVDLLVLMLPDDAFSGSEISAMSNHLARGGRLLFMGEQQSFAAAQNGFINTALAALGSNLLLGSDSLDAGFNNTGNGQILPNALTNGVTTLNYGNVNSVGGTTAENRLLLAKNLSSVWGGVESLNNGSLVVLGDTNLISNLENTNANDNHVFFSNLATVPLPGTLALFALAGGLMLRVRATRRS